MAIRNLACRGLVLIAVGLFACSCGSAGNPSTQATLPPAPTYAQVLTAMVGGRSVHVNETTTAGATADVRANSDGTVLGTMTVTGDGSIQFFAQLGIATTGTVGTSTFDAIPDAGFTAACHCGTPDTCSVFSLAYQKVFGLTAQAMNDQFTPGGLSNHFEAIVGSMSLQGTSTVLGERVFVFKHSGYELDVPEGSRLPIRWVSRGLATIYMGQWASAGLIAKPSSCP